MNQRQDDSNSHKTTSAILCYRLHREYCNIFTFILSSKGCTRKFASSHSKNNTTVFLAPIWPRINNFDRGTPISVHSDICAIVLLAILRSEIEPNRNRKKRKQVHDQTEAQSLNETSSLDVSRNSGGFNSRITFEFHKYGLKLYFQ